MEPAVSSGAGGLSRRQGTYLGEEERKMRIIAGKYRSRVLKSPGAMKLRPTSDRLRETLFSILGGRVEEVLVI